MNSKNVLTDYDHNLVFLCVYLKRTGWLPCSENELYNLMLFKSSYVLVLENDQPASWKTEDDWFLEGCKMTWKCYRFLKANSKPVSADPEHTVQNCALKPFCIKQIFVALKYSVETGFSIGPVFSHDYNQYMHACIHSYKYAYTKISK